MNITSNLWMFNLLENVVLIFQDQCKRTLKASTTSHNKKIGGKIPIQPFLNRTCPDWFEGWRLAGTDFESTQTQLSFKPMLSIVQISTESRCLDNGTSHLRWSVAKQLDCSMVWLFWKLLVCGIYIWNHGCRSSVLNCCRRMNLFMLNLFLCF